jgi:GT2 family glycosyltransferase
MKITIIILNYNGGKDTLQCLNSCYQLPVFAPSSGRGAISYQLSITIVDNNSRDNSVREIKKRFPQVKIIENNENLGFAEGNNGGIRQALKEGSDYVLLLNNDTLVDKNLLVQLIKVMKKDKKTGIVSPKIYFSPGHEFHRQRYKENEKGKVIWYAGGRLDWNNVLTSHRGVDEVDKNQYGRTEETDFATGCCMLIRKEVFEKVGLFDQRYFLYWEDVDLCQKAKEAGFKVIYTGQAFLWHKNAAGSGGAGGKTSVYYQTRNRLIFAFKYAPLRSKAAVLREGLYYLFQGNKWQKKAVCDFLLLKFGKLKE